MDSTPVRGNQTASAEGTPMTVLRAGRGKAGSARKAGPHLAGAPRGAARQPRAAPGAPKPPLDHEEEFVRLSREKHVVENQKSVTGAAPSLADLLNCLRNWGGEKHLPSEARHKRTGEVLATPPLDAVYKAWIASMNSPGFCASTLRNEHRRRVPRAARPQPAAASAALSAAPARRRTVLRSTTKSPGTSVPKRHEAMAACADGAQDWNRQAPFHISNAHPFKVHNIANLAPIGGATPRRKFECVVDAVFERTDSSHVMHVIHGVMMWALNLTEEAHYCSSGDECSDACQGFAACERVEKVRMYAVDKKRSGTLD